MPRSWFEIKHMNKASYISLAIVFCAMFDATNSRADVVVYKESCGHGAYEDWNLTCKIDKNTFNNVEPNGFWADPFRDIQSITICASFHNHGGLNVPATVVYNYKEDRQFVPTQLFDTVKFQGSLVGEKMSWTGTSPRLVPIWGSAWRMRGDLSHDSKADSFVYTEVLSNGQRPIGEIQTTCRYLEDN
jgi:hypothetical protein